MGSRVGSMLSQQCSGGDGGLGHRGEGADTVTAQCYPRQVRREGGEGQGESRSQRVKFRMLKVKLFQMKPFKHIRKRE